MDAHSLFYFGASEKNAPTKKKIFFFFVELGLMRAPEMA
jgi:hypothetical protein